MTTTTQDNAFISDVIGNSVLENAIEWIGHNLNPEDVFDDEPLHDWANEAGYMMEN